MEKSTTSTFVYKRRGFMGRISEGFRFLEHHFRLLLRISALVAVPSALLLALVLVVFRTDIALTFLSADEAGQWFWGLVFVIALAGCVCWNGLMYTVFQQYVSLGYVPSLAYRAWAGRLSGNLWRVFLYVLFIGFVQLVFMALLYMCYMVSVYLAVFLLFVWLFCMVPLAVMPYYYMIDRIPLWFAFLKSYRRGVPLWGGIFGLLVLTGIFYGVVVFIGNLPLLIIQAVNYFATLGQIQGEVIDLPGYYVVLAGFLIALGMVVNFCAVWMVRAPLFYQYVSLVADEQAEEG